MLENERYILAHKNSVGELEIVIQGISPYEMTGVSLYILKIVHKTLSDKDYLEMAELINSIIVPLELIVNLDVEKPVGPVS